MAGSPAILTGHLAHNLLHVLADLDRGDKLLGISSLLKSGETIDGQTMNHPVGFAVVFITLVLLDYLVYMLQKTFWSERVKANTSQIRQIMLRTAGTLMVKSKMQDRRNETSTGLSNHGTFGFLRHAIISPRRLRRDIFLGLAYNVLYMIFSELLSGISSSSLIWNIISHLIVGLLLANLHLRWTCTILLSNRPAGARIISLPSRDLLLPTTVYILAHMLTTKLPAYISKTISVHGQESLRGIAFADSVVIATAFGLRMLILYPAFATYIHAEVKQAGSKDVVETNSNGEETSPGLGLEAYGKAAKLCFRKTAFWFGLLHLQMVVVLAVFEMLGTPVLHKMIF
jgi:hypothetical protein